MVDWQALLPGPVIGVDEVGRGCLAGPVYAAAVILDINKSILDYTDSKQLTGIRRKQLSDHIKTHHKWAIGVASIKEISELNILQASLLAMKRAILQLNSCGHVLVDGNQRIPQLGTGFMQTPIVKGDLRAKPIGAASIVAKVARDEWMVAQAAKFPHYSFDKHKGYCTSEHKEAIQKYGPCEIHRPTFAGVREFLP